MPRNRDPKNLRNIEIIRGYLKHAEGSVLIKTGNTHVICTATVEESVPSFLKGTGKGWITAEYGMLPRSTHKRMQREAKHGKLGGRTHEIQRLIGRSLRAAADITKLGERSILIDCDVIQADGGTRTASITGAYVALVDAVAGLIGNKVLSENPIVDSVAATSVGIIKGVPSLDLDYEEDSTAEVDMNVVMTGSGKIIEIQGTAEGAPFSKDSLDALYALAAKGITELTKFQLDVLGSNASFVPRQK